MKGKVTTFLNERLNIILDNQPFDIWCEEMVDHISISKVPVDLRDYFTRLNITEVEIKSSLSFFSSINPSSDHFILTIKKPVSLSSSYEVRYNIAHEIAHTFQYKNVDGVLTEQTKLLPGSFEIEFFCNRMARSLLVPRKLLLPYLENLPKVEDSNFSLKYINSLSKLFVADYKLILQRSILDLEFFGDYMLLRFLELSEKKNWGLLERYLSNKFNYNKKYYIPFLNKDSRRQIDQRMPLCGRVLNKFLNRYRDDLKINEEKNITIFAEEILDKPLSWFMKNYNKRTLNVCKISRVQSNRREIINVSISLNSKHIT